MYPNNYNMQNQMAYTDSNIDYSNNNIRWVRKNDRFGGSVWVPLILGGAVGYAFGNNNNNYNNARPIYGPFYPVTGPIYWWPPYNNNSNNNNYYF